MNINIKTSNLTTTDAITEYVYKRLQKIDTIVGNDQTIQCDVELAKTTSHHHKGEIFRAEIHIVGAGKNIYTASEKEDLYTAIDDAQSQVILKLKSVKEKKRSLIRRGGARVKDMVKGLWPWKKDQQF